MVHYELIKINSINLSIVVQNSCHCYIDTLTMVLLQLYPKHLWYLKIGYIKLKWLTMVKKVCTYSPTFFITLDLYLLYKCALTII